MRRLGLLGLAAVVAAATMLPRHALAGWPPPPNASPVDLADPANWPNDPSYGFSSTVNGQWSLYSFMPSVATQVRPQETASGMAVDLSWRLTIGDPSIRIAVAGSGVAWEVADLLEQVMINDRELANHKPLHADGSACGGTGVLAQFDCNGDGLLSVSDYKDSPSLTPPASPGHPLGDRNGNGKLDAGDLILSFSDGVDDDGNGYTDDIAGWDFAKDDNDPYDDTRDGHGTTGALSAVAATNNMVGGAGVCPLCRFVALRVADGAAADPTTLGKAIAYATDNGARIFEAGLDDVGMNAFAQAALDYAYGNGTLVIAGMGDLGSRRHAAPATSNHVLVVHAIEHDRPAIADATTFLGFHPCGAFGGQGALSASADGCSGEAASVLSGVAGLLFAEALRVNIAPPLSPGEAQALLEATADDVDVAESRAAGSTYAWSQAGFDQRFGYGRVNAAAALGAVAAGAIPPVVDLVSPEWFTVLYKDQAASPIPIAATVSAKRAASYDYFVEWAPGVQPADGMFTVFAQAVGNAPSVVAGSGAMPLASLDLATVDPTHPRDTDSPHGENDTAITVRVRAVAHYGGAVGDAQSEARRTYYVESDPTLAKGFPIALGDGGEASPKLADLNGDGVRDLIYLTAGGRVLVYSLGANGPALLPGFPFEAWRADGLATPAPTPSTPVYLAAPAYASGGIDAALGREPFVSAPAVGDVDGDGKPEIVATTYAGTIYVVGADGKLKPGWPLRLPLVPSCTHDAGQPKVAPCTDEATRIARGAFAAPALADMDEDGHLDVVQAAFDGNVYVFHGDATPVAGWPVSVHYAGSLASEPSTARIVTTPAIADWNGDGYPDLLVGSSEVLGSGAQAGAMHLLDGRGSNAPPGSFPDWPVTLASASIAPLVAEGTSSAAAIATFATIRIAVMHGTSSAPWGLPRDPGAQTMLGADPVALVKLDPPSAFGPLTKATFPDTFAALFAQPSLGDVDQDGMPDVVAGGASLAIVQDLAAGVAAKGAAGQHMLAMWSGQTGKMLPASPMVTDDFAFASSHAIVDLDGDDYPEVVTGSGGYFLHAFDGCGREPSGWPKRTGQTIAATPAIGDLDGDHKLEVAVATREGWLYVWHTDGADDGVVQWESFRHDNRNTGNLDEPLEQGTKGRKAKVPLTVTTCAPVADAGADGGGSTDGGASSDGGALDASGPTPVDSGHDPASAAEQGGGDSGGCGCRVERRGCAHAGAAVALIALLVFSRRSRRRRGPSRANAARDSSAPMDPGRLPARSGEAQVATVSAPRVIAAIAKG